MSRSQINEENCNKIQMGMTLVEVEKILGRPADPNFPRSILSPFGESDYEEKIWADTELIAVLFNRKTGKVEATQWSSSATAPVTGGYLISAQSEMIKPEKP